MQRRDWLIHLSIVIGIWLVDFVTKWIAMRYITGINYYGPIGLVVHFNPGAMLGAFSNLPPVLRVVSLSTGGAFLVFIYLAIQHLIPVPAKALRYGMSILLGGILGNVFDRIWRGAVTDFLMIGTPANSTPAFNFADAVQWVGYALIVVSLIRDGHLFWPENNIRKKMWVNPTFQVKFVVTLLAGGFGYMLICGVFFFTYLKVTIDALVIGSAVAVEQRFLLPFFIVFMVISVGFLLTLFMVAKIISHRMAGPLYAFEKYLEELLAGQDRELKLRAGDEFRHLEELSSKLRARLISKSEPP